MVVNMNYELLKIMENFNDLQKGLINDYSEYEVAVEHIASRHQNIDLHNKGEECALIVYENILKNAHEDVRVAMGSFMDNNVVNNQRFISALSAYLKQPQSRLKILLTEFDSEYWRAKNDSLLAILYGHPAYKEGRIEIKNSDGKKFLSDGNAIHFLVADNLMYRLETNIEERSSICNFGDADFSRVLISVFDSAFGSTSEVVNLKNVYGE